MADTIGEAELKRDYPVTSGLEANQKHEGRNTTLQYNKSFVLDRNKEGID